MSGVDLDRVVEAEQLIEQTVVELHGELADPIVARQIRPADAAHEQRVACQNEPGVLAPRAVANEIADALRAVARRVQNANVIVAELYLVAIAKGHVGKDDIRRFVEVHLCPEALRHEAGGRGVVGLHVGLEYVADRAAGELRKLEVLLDVLNVGVAHGELALALSAEEVRGTAGARVEDLAKDHLLTPSRSIGSGLDWQTSSSPLRVAVRQTLRLTTTGREKLDRLICVDAIRATAVRDDRSILR